MNSKKMVFDSLFNILATAVPVIVLQIVILPLVGVKLGQENYGVVITLISVSTVFSIPFGNVLNNIRLLMDEKYKENDVVGDFNFLLICSVFCNTFLVIASLIIMKSSLNVIHIILLILVSGLNIVREYFLVGFRLSLNYKKILENNIIQAIGYLIGLIIFNFLNYWELIYISGLLLSIYFIFKNSDLYKEGIVRSILFKDTFYQSCMLFISVFLKTFLTYADRILLFPLLGATAVSIYYSSSVVGKILGMAIMPISSVILSYLRNSNELSKKNFIKLLIVLLSICFISYFVINIISYPLLKLLYPKWYYESIKLIPVNTATALIVTITSILHPFLLKFRHMKWQMIINIVNLLSYIIFIYVLFNAYGLLGFCLGLLISNIIKLFLMIGIYVFSN